MDKIGYDQINAFLLESFQLEVCLSVHDLSVDTRRYKVKGFEEGLLTR